MSMQYYYQNLKSKEYTDETFEQYVDNPNTKKIFTKEEISELRKLWYGIGSDITAKEAAEFNATDHLNEDELMSMNKDELDEYSLMKFGIDLDKRHNKKTMIQELRDKLSKGE